MSSTLDCRIIHLTTGWFYLLEQEGGEEWMAYGPFSSYAKAFSDFGDYASGTFDGDPEDGPAREPSAWEAEQVAKAYRRDIRDYLR